MSERIPFKVATANLNQTIENFTRNVPNIKAAIDRAVEGRADFLGLQELGLTGYSGDDQFKWIREQAQGSEILALVQEIADYAAAKDPNLVVSLGFPFFHAEKDQPPVIEPAPGIRLPNALYNISNRPFNAQAFISGGRIQAISAKSIQPDGAAEYEPRQFASWPEYMGTRTITLPTGQQVPFGKPVVQLRGREGQTLNLYHEICAEAWPGLADDGTINEREQQEVRYLTQLAKEKDISFTFNPSASKPEPALNKPHLRGLLCSTGSQITGGGTYAYANALGNEAGYAAMEGDAIFAENGEVVHRGKCYRMEDINYTSCVLQAPIAERGAPDVVVEHEFGAHVVEPAARNPGIDDDLRREYRDIVSNTVLWMRDYLQKTGQQGFIISLSGGADSAYGAVMVTTMIDHAIDQFAETLGDRNKAVDAFINQFQHLAYRSEVLDMNAAEGPDAAIELIKKRMLTCVTMPSQNSSKTTRSAARMLIEGGQLEDGTVVKGIGGTLHTADVQEVVDAYMETFVGIVRRQLPEELKKQVRSEIRGYIAGERDAFSPEVQAELKRRVPRWPAEKDKSLWTAEERADDLTLQNIQARARQPVAWLYANQENKLACVTSNLSEAFAGYWTFGGDGHMGGINLCGGVFKSDLRNILKELQNDGLGLFGALPVLEVITKQRATADLRPTDGTGQAIQADEDDLMPYPQLDAIARTIIVQKNSPVEAYHILQKVRAEDGGPLFANNEELVACIDRACGLWHISQFKRIASVITPFLGNNMDPHQAIRTTVLNDGFQTGRAMLKIAYLNDTLGAEAVGGLFGAGPDEVRLRAQINEPFRRALIRTAAADLPGAVVQPDFGKGEVRQVIAYG